MHAIIYSCARRGPPPAGRPAFEVLSVPRLTNIKPRFGAAPKRFGHASKADGNVRRQRGLINTAAWQRARAAFLAEARTQAAERGDVLRCCKTRVVLSGRHPEPHSPVVDHIEAHRGDATLFWDRANWQIVSKQWHDREKQSFEKGGRARP